MNRRNALKNISIGMGLSISTGTLLTMISSCKTEPSTDGNTAAVTDNKWLPVFIKNKDHAMLISKMSEAILPATNTPGATEAGVLQYIDMVVGNVYSPKEQDRFQRGLAQSISKMEADQGTSFTKLTTKQVDAFMQKHMGANANKTTYETARKLIWSEEVPTDPAQQDIYYLYSFLHAIKSLTVSGYFGSELIATKHLNYLPIPGPFEGCIDYPADKANYAL